MKAARDTLVSLNGTREPKGQVPKRGTKLSGQRIAAGQVSGQVRESKGAVPFPRMVVSGQRTHLFDE